jgi:hypothetical protein
MCGSVSAATARNVVPRIPIEASFVVSARSMKPSEHTRLASNHARRPLCHPARQIGEVLMDGDRSGYPQDRRVIEQIDQKGTDRLRLVRTTKIEQDDRKPGFSHVPHMAATDGVSSSTSQPHQSRHMLGSVCGTMPWPMF